MADPKPFAEVLDGLAARIIPGAVIFADDESHVADLRQKAAALIRPMLAALYEADDALDGYSDADHDGEGFVPNRAMSVLQEVRDAIAVAEATP